jgi:hypothetical protein
MLAVLFVTFWACAWTADCFQASTHILKLQKANPSSHFTMLKSNLGLFRPSSHKRPALRMSGLLVDSSYNLAIGSLILGTIFGVLENNKGPAAKVWGGGAILFTAFAAFIAFQTTTLRFQFDDSSFSLVKLDGNKVEENIVVGGANSWRYDSFVNYDFLPSKSFPILVYFKETQTPTESRVEAPIVVDAAIGQPHFFPAIANIEQLERQFVKHQCAKL